MKVKLPFRDNSILDKSVHKAQIMTVVADATTKDVLQVSVDVINKGLFPSSFFVYLCKCPMKYVSSAKTIVERTLVPYVRETVTFILPLIDSSRKPNAFNCEGKLKN